MARIITRQNSFCFILGTINLLYALLIAFMAWELFTAIKEFGWGGFIIKNIYVNCLVFGTPLVFAFLVFPAITFIMWKVKEQIKWIDYTFLVVPLLLWFFCVLDGSMANFLYINFPVVWAVSLIYLFRFSEALKRKNIYIVSISLWVLIVAILLCARYVIPPLPE